MEPAAFPGFPVTLRLAGRICVVVGGGSVALRKAQKLLRAGARVRVIAPQIHPELSSLVGIEIIAEVFRPELLKDAFLVFAVTNDRTVNATVTATAGHIGALVNVSDASDEGDFHLPAVIRRGRLSIAIASDGASPALAVRLKDDLSCVIGPEWTIVCEIVAALRRKELTAGKGSAYNSAAVSRLLNNDLTGTIASGDAAAVDQLLQRIVGDGTTLATLGVRFGKGTI